MNSNFENILAKSFKEFSDFTDDNVSLLSDSKLNFLFKGLYPQVWRIETGLYDEENSVWIIEDLTVYIAFSNEFPLVPAKLFFNITDLPKIGHIPHVTIYDKVCDICAFDEFVIIDSSKPTQAIIEQYGKAKKTLKEGIKNKNHSDFEDEFIAYWENESDSKDKIDNGYFSIIGKEPEQTDDIQVLIFRFNLDEESPKYALLFNKQEDTIESYKNYLESVELEFKIQNVFYLGEIEGLEKPPFSLTIEQSHEFVKQNQLNKHRNFINDVESPFKIHVFLKKIQGKTYYLGWRFPTLKMKNLKGFRKGSLSYYQFLSYGTLGNAQKNVFRFVSNDLNLKRLIKRTSTDFVKTPKAKILIAGVGSVGSNLIIPINSLNFPDFTLVDNDTLDVENIGRHLLGFKYLNKPKVDALKLFLKGKLPTQKIQTYKNKVTDLYNTNSDIFNNQDYIFFCTGKQNIEKWFIEEIEKGNLKKPIFILWVEPYLLGGQCIYIHPNSKVSISDLFYDVYKYKHAVIDQEELTKKRDLFTFKESGCQSTYSPYSSSHLSLFISAIYPEIFQILETNSQQSMAFTWVGDTKVAKQLDIKINIDVDKYSLIVKKT